MTSSTPDPQATDAPETSGAPTGAAPQPDASTPAAPGTEPAGGAPQRSPEKDPSEWATGGEPATGPQLSYLSTLAQEAGVEVPESLNKADASKLIDELQEKTGRGGTPAGG